jgi:hypothetical protein
VHAGAIGGGCAGSPMWLKIRSTGAVLVRKATMRVSAGGAQGHHLADACGAVRGYPALVGKLCKLSPELNQQAAFWRASVLTRWLAVTLLCVLRGAPLPLAQARLELP